MRSFRSIEDAEVELRRISTAVRPYIAVKASAISVRGRKPAAKPSVGTSRTSKLFQNVSALEKLREQNKLLDNLLANIRLQFPDDELQVQRIIKAANVLKRRVEEHLTEQSSISNDRAQQHISPEVVRLAKQIQTYYKKKLNVPSNISYADGLKENQHIMCAYISFHDVKNYAGEVTPLHIVAITQIGEDYYINPGLHKEQAPGKFNKGFPIHTRNDAVRYVDAQLEADSNLSTINPKPVPIDKDHFVTTKAKTVRFTEDSITATLPANVKTQEAAQEAANELYKELRHIITSIDPKNKDRITYAMKKTKTGYTVVFKFVSGSANHGRTLRREETKVLQQVFTEDEIKRIRRAIAE